MVNQSEISSYWEKEVCGTRHSRAKDYLSYYGEIRKKRYRNESYIKDFIKGKKKGSLKNKLLLEIGVGIGTDFVEFLREGAVCYGVDATQAAIKETRRNLKNSLKDVSYKLNFLQKCNAEKLPFDDNTFDIVYSHGVLHHAENTMTCFSEAIRVLKPGGNLRIMVYSNFSATGIMLWLLYGLFKGKPFLNQEKIIKEYLESPGTKSYSKKELAKILNGFGLEKITLKKFAGSGDLLLIPPSLKYKKNIIFYIIKKIYPRTIVSRLQSCLGLALTVNAYKQK